MGWDSRRFAREMKKFDPLLRIRQSEDGSRWLIERKCQHGSPCLVKPSDRQAWDAYQRNRDGYTLTTAVPRDRLNHAVLMELRAADMWEYRGAGPYFDQWVEAQRVRDEAQRKRDSTVFQDQAGEMYDLIRSKERRIEAGFHPKTETKGPA